MSALLVTVLDLSQFFNSSDDIFQIKLAIFFKYI